MSLYKRPDSPQDWHYSFTIQGHRFRGSTGIDERALAEQYEARLKRKKWKELHLGKKQEITLDAACGRYWLEIAQFQTWGKTGVKPFTPELLAFMGKSTLLSQVNDSLVSRYVAFLRTKKPKPNANATVNRKLAILRRVMNKGREWGYNVGAVNFASHRLEEPDCRTRWEDAETIDLILSKIEKPVHRNIIRFALYTGVRRENALACRWEDVYMERGFIEFKVKSRRPGGKIHRVPIWSGLADLLLKLGHSPEAKGHIFQRTFKKAKPRRYVSVKKVWQMACNDAGVEDFRFHDLRHTCASWLVQNGAPIEVVQKILGHASITTTMKYAHHRKDAKREAMELLGASRIGHGPEPMISGKKEKVA